MTLQKTRNGLFAEPIPKAHPGYPINTSKDTHRVSSTPQRRPRIPKRPQGRPKKGTRTSKNAPQSPKTSQVLPKGASIPGNTINTFGFSMVYRTSQGPPRTSKGRPRTSKERPRTSKGPPMEPFGCREGTAWPWQIIKMICF